MSYIYIYAKASSSVVSIHVLYMDNVGFIGNDVFTLRSVEASHVYFFTMKHLGEEAYVLNIRIYGDKSDRFIGSSQSTWNIKETSNVEL